MMKSLVRKTCFALACVAATLGPRLFAQDIARHIALANIVKQRAHDEILQLQAGAVILELLV